jgi:hypothetical protein
MDGTNLTYDTISIGREGSTTTIGSETLSVANIGVGPSNTLSLAGNVNVSVGAPISWVVDKINQTTTTLSSGFTRNGTFGKDTFVFSGYRGEVITTKDGLTFNILVNGTTGTDVKRGVAFGNDIFVMATEENPGKKWTSTDGYTWQASANFPSNGPNSIAFGNGWFVGVNSGSVTFRSQDGIAWTSGTASGEWYGITYGNGIFVACGKNVFSTSSTNGLTWTTTTAFTGEWNSIAYGNGIFAACSWQSGVGGITTSTNGTTWTTTYPLGRAMSSIICIDKVWIVTDSTWGMYISYDNCATFQIATLYGASDIVYGNGKLIGTGPNKGFLFTNRTKNNGFITTDAITIGQEGTTTNIIGETIRQTVSCLGGGTIENVFGNTTNVTSLSTTYNRKNTVVTTAIPCYALVCPANYSGAYFEIIVSGSNQNAGAYSYKGCFSINILTVSAVTTLFSSPANAVTISFTGTSETFSVPNRIMLNILATPGASSNQCFLSTLISYPTITIENTLNDYTITAI